MIVGVRQVVDAPASYSANFDGRHDMALADLVHDGGASLGTAGINQFVGLGTHEWGLVRQADPISRSFMTWGPVVGARVAVVVSLVVVGTAAYVWATAQGISPRARSWCASLTAQCVAGGSVVPVIFVDLYAINTSFPMYAAGALLMCSAVAWLMRPIRRTARVAALVTLVLLVHWWAIVYTHYLLLVVPPLACVAICEYLVATDRSAALRSSLAGSAAVISSLAATGVGSFVAGFFGYTAAVAANDSYAWSPRSLRPFSVTFIDALLPQHGLGAGGGLAVGVILVTSLASYMSKLREVKAVGFLAIVALVFALAYRISERFWWRELGPSPAYVSWILFPFIVPAVVLGLGQLMARARGPWLVRPIVLAVVIVSVTLVRATTVDSNPTHAWRTSRGYTALDRSLGAIAFGVGSDFTGRAVFMPRLASPDTLDAEVTAPFAEAMTERIPLLNAHSHLQTPLFVDAMQSLLARASDPQRRAHLTLRSPDRRLLDLFGVRYVVTDSRAVSGYPPGRVDADLAALTKFASVVIHESNSYNDGSFSPTRQHRVDALSDALDLLRDADFDPETEVILAGQSLPRLVAAAQVRVVRTASGLRVRAKSAGTSLIVLPWEYSRCWKIAGGRTGDSTRLVLVDGVLLGVLFEREVDTSLSFRHQRVLGWRDCRLADLVDYRRLRGG